MIPQTEVPPDLITFAVGDIHGCLHKLENLLDRCLNYASGQPARFVFLGDYVDRGPDSRGVIETLRDAQLAGMHEVICLRGNHEAMMLAAAHGQDVDLWLANGADPTLASYGTGNPQSIPQDHLNWLASLPFSFDDGHRFFVHAGVDPARALDRQTEHDRIWMREPFLSSERDFGRLIVHGHTPLRHGLPDLRRNRLNLDTGAVLAGPLTAAAFAARRIGPVAFLTDREERPLA